MPSIRPFHPTDAAAWDAYVNAHPDGTFFHLSGWREVLEEGLRHETRYLCAWEGDSLKGLLPLARVRSRLFGDALISTPFCVYGGVLADDEETGRQLEDHAAGLAEDLNVDYLELRNLQRQREDWPTKDLYVTFRKAIEPDEEANMKAIPRKQRAMVRKGIKAGL
ncbi:MAG: peptidoglycan bridge formation protein FemAB, partial [Gammaproteobacteria bacterium]